MEVLSTNVYEFIWDNSKLLVFFKSIKHIRSLDCQQFLQKTRLEANYYSMFWKN